MAQDTPEKKKPLVLEIGGKKVIIDREKIDPIVKEVVDDVGGSTGKVIGSVFKDTEIHTEEKAESIPPDAISD